MNEASIGNNLRRLNPFKPGFAARLREERETHGYTQAQLAELIGINRMTQYLYEREVNVPNINYLSAIADVGLDVFYVLFGTRGAAGPELRFSPPELLYEIYDAVDAIATDSKGILQPREVRKQFFILLCAAYSGQKVDKIDVTSLSALVGNIANTK